MNLKNIIESLLLVAEKPVSSENIAIDLQVEEKEVLSALFEIKEDYKNRGIILTQKEDLFELTTNPDNASYVIRFLNQELRGNLSQSALEVLAIILYKQPVTRSDIEEIRGVNSDQAVRNLLIRGLIEEKGRRETPGRPALYGTSLNLLKHFGFASEDEIPPLTETSHD